MQSGTEEIVVHTLGKQIIPYRKIWECGCGAGYERVMSPEERKLFNQNMVTKILQTMKLR
ncbi:MAG TPA: hypothetical protein GX499_04280 [Clostridiales bacterium]|nr:hypothetical protein [Clostridiales bacterium]